MPVRSRRRRLALHAAAWLVGLTAFRVGLAAPQQCEPVTVSELDAAIDDAAGWAADHLTEQGRFLYRFDRASGRDLGGYNEVRHAAMTNALYQLASEGDLRWLDATDRTLEYMLSRLVDTSDGATAFAPSGTRPRLGSSALLLASLVHRRQATGDQTHDVLMRRVGTFLVEQIEPNGAPANEWDPATSAPVVGSYGAFATGEAAWALALLDSTFVGEDWGTHGRRIIDWVINDRRADEGLLLRIPDHWIAYALADLDPEHRPADEPARRYIERLGGDFALMRRVEAQRGDSGIQSVVRYGHALGAGVGAMGEGLAGLWRLATMENADPDSSGATRSGLDSADAVALRAHLLCTASILVDRQVTAATSSGDDREVGAWFRNDITQVDDQQHTLSTLLFARRALAEETNR